MYIANKVHYFCLSTTGTVNHAVYRGAQLIEYRLDNRGISTSGRQHELTCIDRGTLYGIGKSASAAVYEFLGYRVVVSLGNFSATALQNTS